MRVPLQRMWSTGCVVVMYLRTTSRRNADGSIVRYLALAHNERVEGQSRARVLLNLGREDDFDVAAPAGVLGLPLLGRL